MGEFILRGVTFSNADQVTGSVRAATSPPFLTDGVRAVACGGLDEAIERVIAVG